MREIKFRAWYKYRKIMSEIMGLYPTRGGGVRVQLKGDNIIQPVGTFELMQFTGLKDKNGKEIYEGDIFSIDGEVLPMPVIFNYGKFELKDSYDLAEAFATWARRQNNVEVIGNIYENPEILK